MLSKLKLKAVVLDGYTLNPGDNPWSELEKLTDLEIHDRTPEDQLLCRAADAEILFTNKTPLRARHIEQLPRLKFISVLATGTNVVDLEATAKRGIPVSNVPTYGTETVAQHSIALLLELCHRCGDHAQAVRKGEWTRSPDFCFWKSPLIELTGKTMGIAGYGRIGRQAARIAEALGMKVQYFSRHVETEATAAFVSWPEFLETSDVISLHCALTPQSAGMIDRVAIGQMKPTAFVINTSRGGLIHEGDLAEALNSGRIAGAAVDVLSEEPPLGNPLIDAQNCLITPHMAWTGIQARRRLMSVTIANVQAFLRGAPMNVC